MTMAEDSAHAATIPPVTYVEEQAGRYLALGLMLLEPALGEHTDSHEGRALVDAAALIRRLSADLARVTAERDEAVAALKPFAKRAVDYEDHVPTSHATMKVSDLNRARAVLAKIGGTDVAPDVG